MNEWMKTNKHEWIGSSGQEEKLNKNEYVSLPLLNELSDHIMMAIFRFVDFILFYFILC